jgi:hypothetical protein
MLGTIAGVADFVVDRRPNAANVNLRRRILEDARLSEPVDMAPFGTGLVLAAVSLAGVFDIIATHCATAMLT